MSTAEVEPAESQPLYMALADRVHAEVSVAAPGSRVASEPELAAEHGVSRLTARAALQELERRLVVHRVRGSGTFVAHRIQYPVGPTMTLGLADLIRQAGAVPTHTVDSIRTRRPTPAMLSQLDLDADDKVVTIVRTGRVDGLCAWHETTHLVHELVEGITDNLAETPGASLAELLGGFGLDPVIGHARAELGVLPAVIADLLGVGGRPLAWDVEVGISARVLDRPVASIRRWLRADVFHLCFETG